MWFIGVEVEQETSAPPPKKNPGSAPGFILSSSADFIGVQFRGKGESFLVKLRVAVLSGRYRGNREM